MALLLRINKELIRLCVELQAKQLVSDPVYREAAVRLQANLGYLAVLRIRGKTRTQADPQRPAQLCRSESFPSRSEHGQPRRSQRCMTSSLQCLARRRKSRGCRGQEALARS